MCEGRISKILIGGVSLVIVVSTVVIIVVMRAGGQTNTAVSQVIKNKS